MTSWYSTANNKIFLPQHNPVFEPILSPISGLISTVSPFSPTHLTFNLEYSKPLIGTYESIDNLPYIRKKILDYYYDLIRDDWLLDDLNDILNYFDYNHDKVEMIKQMSEYNRDNVHKDTDDIAEKKVEFIEKHLFTKYDLFDVLGKFTEETGTKWVDLPKNEFFVKKLVKEYIMKSIKKELKRNMKK